MKYMGIDYGDVRTGIAMSDVNGFLASGVCTLKIGYNVKLAEEIVRMAEEQGVGGIVLGNPINMDGSQGFRSEKCKAFARELSELTGIPTEMYDERLTTVSAHKILNDNNVRGKKRKATVDTLSARLILEDYLTMRKNRGTV